VPGLFPVGSADCAIFGIVDDGVETAPTAGVITSTATTSRKFN